MGKLKPFMASFCIFLLLGGIIAASGQAGAPISDTETADSKPVSVRPWVKPSKNWSLIWGSGIGLSGRPGLVDSSNKWWKRRSKGDSVASRRLDPTKPWLKPSNNWGQLGRSGIQSSLSSDNRNYIDFLRNKPVVGRVGLKGPATNFGRGWKGPGGFFIPSVDGRPFSSWNKPCSKSKHKKVDPKNPWLSKPSNNLILDDLGCGNLLPTRPRIPSKLAKTAGRRRDPSRPSLLSSNNWGQGWGSRPPWDKVKPGWKPVEVDPSLLPAFQS